MSPELYSPSIEYTSPLHIDAPPPHVLGWREALWLKYISREHKSPYEGYNLSHPTCVLVTKSYITICSDSKWFTCAVKCLLRFWNTCEQMIICYFLRNYTHCINQDKKFHINTLYFLQKCNFPRWKIFISCVFIFAYSKTKGIYAMPDIWSFK